MNPIMRSRGRAGRGPGSRWTAGAACAGAILLSGLASAGCTATVGGELVYGHPVYEAEVVPVEIETYPRVYYGGGYAYLVEDRWYYQGPRGWVIFREEPRELYRYRSSLPREHRARRAPPPRARPRAPQEQQRRYYPR